MSSLLSVPVSEIVVPEYRQRVTPLDKAKIVELRESFQRGKQIHPIVLRRETIDGTERWLLVAGFRRLCTRKLAPTHMMRCGTLSLEAGHIAATDWGSLDDIERRELELDENVLRVDLTVAEKAAAIGDLHRVREAQARQRGEIYTVSQLADDARVSPNKSSPRERVNETSLMLSLSKYVGTDPQVSKIKNMAEARSYLQKKMSVERNTELRKAFEAAGTSGSSNRLLFGNSYDPAIIEQLPCGQFDVACFDPPYGVNAHAFGDQGGASPGNAGHLYADTPELFDEVCNRVPLLLDKLLRPEAHVYSFCSAEPAKFLQLAAAFEFAGFKVWPRPLIWVKNRGIAPVPTGGPRYTYEVILFASRGDKPVEVLANDVLAHVPVATPRHGAEKPVSLLVDLLMRSVRPGNLVLDLFAGSGSIFPAANATHCVAWGVEREQQYYDLALTRLAEKPGSEPVAPGEGDSDPLKEI